MLAADDMFTYLMKLPTGQYGDRGSRKQSDAYYSLDKINAQNAEPDYGYYYGNYLKYATSDRCKITKLGHSYLFTSTTNNWPQNTRDNVFAMNQNTTMSAMRILQTP